MQVLKKFIFLLFLSKSAFAQIGYTEKGRASYYAHDFHGRYTANGELFDMEALTAAHPSLSFNCLVKVVNLENNKTVVVRINDRGPYMKKRILDLSRSAANALGIVEKGTANVKLEVIGYQGNLDKRNSSVWAEKKLDLLQPNNTYTRQGELEKLVGFGVQIGAFRVKENALKACMKFEAKGIECHIKVLENNGSRLYRVIVGEYLDEESAIKKYLDLKKRGWPGFIICLNV